MLPRVRLRKVTIGWLLQPMIISYPSEAGPTETLSSLPLPPGLRPPHRTEKKVAILQQHGALLALLTLRAH
eukprot:scaffold156258_cov33-Tisochrysis_lutea.AAC.2